MRKFDVKTVCKLFNELVLAIEGLKNDGITIDECKNNYILDDGTYFEDCEMNAYMKLSDGVSIEIFGDYDPDFVESIDNNISKVTVHNFDSCCLVSIILHKEEDEAKRKLLADTIYKVLAKFLLDGKSSINTDSLWIIDTDYTNKDVMPQNLACISSL